MIQLTLKKIGQCLICLIIASIMILITGYMFASMPGNYCERNQTMLEEMDMRR